MVLVLTLKFIALKTGFPPVKNTSQIYFDFFYIYSMQLFSADTTIFSKQTSPELIFHIINMSQDSSVSFSVFEI